MDGESSRQLTPDQTEILINFQNLSGLDSLEECRQILEKSHWELSIAVQEIFGYSEGFPRLAERGMGEGNLAAEDPSPIRRIPRIYADQTTPELAISPSTHASYTGGAAPLERWGTIDWIKAVIALPFRFVFGSLLEVFNFLSPSSATQDVQGFIEEFEQKYGSVHPTFYRGSYKEAYGDAKRELRYLLLYLHQDNHGDSERFCRDTLISPDVVQLINTRTLFWGCSTKFSEGHKVAQALQTSRFPSLGLIASKGSQMTLVGRLQGYHTPQELTQRLTQLFSANDRYLNAAVQERRQLDQNQSLRKEQDEAYLKSLKADQDKEKAKREEKLNKELAERKTKEAVERKEREERLRGEDLNHRKQRAAGLIPHEPAESHPDVCRVSVKLPVGKRLERRFLNSNTVGDLYNYIFSQTESPEHFEVFTSYPRKSIECVPGSTKTLQSLGMGNANAFIVEEKDLEESDADL